ncbi:uncharacterized protein LOC105633569 isoform X2 [Jatropha curcas]|uniref:uncharacterized protein LOC105633569 isoform X2 n=1 Tax=Jatropha curcas TaxID=180498 RepID=UPI0009D680C7|nr:uncharacterized protein LOC105633569 isoform X2 [Jatropha curcas]
MSWEVAKELFSAEWVKDLWAAFEVQVLVIASLFFQIVLAVFAARRKYHKGVTTRFIVWFAYLMGTYVSIVALGKLTETTNDSIALTSISFGDTVPRINITNNELRAMWAPLLLVHIGGPDSITAYAVEDNRLGIRQFLELAVQISVVGLIFIKSWNNSWLSITALALLLSGAIKSLQRVWCLRCSAITEPVFDNLASSEALQIKRVSDLKPSIPDLPLLIKAYIRFEHLKPHLQNWIGHPLSIHLPSMSTHYSKPEDTFRIAEIELSYMYDMLYTRAPINYSTTSFVLRVICFLCLVSSLCGFAILFRNADIQLLKILVLRKYDKKVDIAITYLLLVSTVTMEIYALRTILCSDWSVLSLIKEQRNYFVDASVQFFARLIPRPPRWSNEMEQLNMLHYCLHEEPSRTSRFISRVLRNIPGANRYQLGWDQSYKRFCITQLVRVDDQFKKFIVKQIEEVRGQRVWQAFSKRGEWALERYKCLDQFKWSIESDHTNEANAQTSFGRAITVWHIATEACLDRDPLLSGKKEKHTEPQDTLTKELCRFSYFLSNYMMYLLAVRPHMLSIGTGNVLFQGASEKLSHFLESIRASSPSASSSSNKEQ